MFNIGQLIIYSGQGICHIDNICEKTYLGVSKSYYVLHPIENCKLTISTPVDNDKVIMLELIDRDEAEKIIESFKLPGMDWVEIVSERAKVYQEIIKRGNRREISKVLNTTFEAICEKVINFIAASEGELAATMDLVEGVDNK